MIKNQYISTLNPNRLLKSLALSFTLCFSGTSLAALVNVGNGLINDTDLNITWTQDANLFLTQVTASGNAANFVASVINSVGGVIHDSPNSYDNAGPGNYSLSRADFNTSTGCMTWWGAQAWVGYLNSIQYGGYTGWRLPTSDMLCAGPNCTGSEMGHLLFTELGGIANRPILNYEVLSNVFNAPIDVYNFWSSTESIPLPSAAMVFDMNNGSQGLYFKFDQKSGLAVTSGQVAAVPIPAAFWLFGSVFMSFVACNRFNAQIQ